MVRGIVAIENLAFGRLMMSMRNKPNCLAIRPAAQQSYFVSFGELVHTTTTRTSKPGVRSSPGFDLRVPCCPRCRQEHWYSTPNRHWGDGIDKYGIFTAFRVPACDDTASFTQETQILVEKTSHYQWYLLTSSNREIFPAAQDTVLIWSQTYRNASFIKIWENDPWYCLAIHEGSDSIRTPATPDMTCNLVNLAFFTEFLQEKFASKDSRMRLDDVYISNE